MADKKYKVDNKTYEIPDAEAQALDRKSVV